MGLRRAAEGDRAGHRQGPQGAWGERPRDVPRRTGLILRSPSRAARAGAPVAWGCFAAVALAAILFARRHAVDWVYGDDLLTIGWLARIRDGTLDGWGVLTVWDNQHPVGVQTALTWLLSELVGLHLKAVVYLSFAVVLATAALAWRLVRSDAEGPGADAALVLSFGLLALHPTETEHLLWAFELGWFLVNGCVVANAWLVERLGLRALPPVMMLCLVASLSSAQGAFAWFAASLHVALSDRSRRSRIASAGLALCGALAIARIAARSAAIGQDPPLALGALTGLPVYGLQILGTSLGLRNHAGLAAAGVALLGLAAALGIRLAGAGGEPRRLRCAAVFAAFSALSVASFARGRIALGLDWALGSFHAAPLLVPFGFAAVFLIAAAVPCLRRGDRGTAALAGPLALLVAAGWVSSCPYGLQRARLWTMDMGYAAWAACRREVPFDVAVRAAGAEPYAAIFAAAQPRLSTMCHDRPSALEAQVTRVPALFAQLSSEHPEAREALGVVWQDYATEILLQRAFDPDRSDTPARLLALAKAEAARGAPFDHVRWAPFAAVLAALPSP